MWSFKSEYSWNIMYFYASHGFVTDQCVRNVTISGHYLLDNVYCWYYYLFSINWMITWYFSCDCIGLFTKYLNYNHLFMLKHLNHFLHIRHEFITQIKLNITPFQNWGDFSAYLGKSSLCIMKIKKYVINNTTLKVQCHLIYKSL